MTLAAAKQLASHYGLQAEIDVAYRFFKPWWRFWVSEEEAAHMALADWDLHPVDPPPEKP